MVRTKTRRPSNAEYAGTSCVPFLRPGVEYESSRSGQSHTGMKCHRTLPLSAAVIFTVFRRIAASFQGGEESKSTYDVLHANVEIPYGRPHFPPRLAHALGGLEPKLFEGGCVSGMPKK